MCKNVTFYDDFVVWGSDLDFFSKEYAIFISKKLNLALKQKDYDSFYEILNDLLYFDIEIYEVVNSVFYFIVEGV